MGFFDSFFGPSETKTTTKVEIPKWIEDAGKSNYDLAQSIGNKGFTPYTGENVADFTGSQNKVLELINSFKPRSLETGEFGIDMSRLGEFQNPYTEEVTNRAIRDYLEVGDMQKEQLDNQFHAGGEGAFGDARAGVYQAELDSNIASGAGDLSARMYGESFDKALQALIGDTSVAGQQQDQVSQYLSSLFGYGSAEQGQEQSELDALRAEFDREEGFDDETLNRLISTLSGTPFSKTQVSTEPGASPFGQTVGTGLTLASMFI